MKQLVGSDWLHSLSVFRIWMKMIWLRHLEYRFNAIVHSFGSLFWLGATFIMYYLVFQQIDSLAGWTWHEMLFLYSIYNLWWGLMVCFFNGGLIMRNNVRQGTLDKFLLYPGKSIVYATMKFEPELLPHFLVGLGMFIYVANQIGVLFQTMNLILFLILILNSLLIAYFVSILFGATAFWFTENQQLASLFWNWETLAKYPPDFFKQSKILYWAVYSILPVVFIVAVPTKVLLGEINILTIASAFIINLILGLSARKIWRLGLKRYSGVSK